MNASKFPKPLGYLFMVQLAALISVLFFTIDEIWDGITYVICIQVVGVALGGACLAGPSAKGKQKEMLNILGVVMMVPIITFLIPYLFADEFVNWDQSNIRIFSMLTFYATAFPMLFFGLFVLREGWGANPKSARVLFFMNLFFLLGVIGKLETDRAVESGVLLGAIQFAAIMAMLILLRLPILAGWRWQFLGFGSAAFLGPVALGMWQESYKVFFGSAALLNALALYLLRDKELPDESRSRGGRLFIVLNMFAPIGLFLISMDWIRRGSRDEEMLLFTPAILFVLGVALLFSMRAKAKENEDIKDLLPTSLLREVGAVSFLAGAAMVSIVVLLGEANRGDRDGYIFYGYALLFLNSAYLFIRGFVLRWISEAARLLINRWTPRMGVVLVLLLLAWVANGWLAERMWDQHKAAGEAEGWKYNREHYIGELPANENNFFMALPFNVYAPHATVPFSALFWDELPEPEPIDFSDPPQGMMPGMMPPPPDFQSGMMQPGMPVEMMPGMMPASTGMMGMADKAMPAPVSRREVDALLDRAPFIERAVQSEVFLNWGFIAQTLRADIRKGDRIEYFGEKPETGLTDEELLDQYFGQFDKMFGALSRAAKRPEHHLPLYYRGLDTPLSHIMAMKRMNWLLKYSALAKLDEGDVEGAMADIRLQFRVFEAGGSGQFTMSQLGHAGYGALIVETVNACLHSGKLTSDHMDELKKMLTLDEDYLGQFERSQQIERITTGPLFIKKLIEGEEMEVFSRKMKEALQLSSKRRLYNDLIYYDTKMKDYVTLIREAKRLGHIDLAKVDALFTPVKIEATLKGYMFSQVLLPSSGSIKRMGAIMNRFSAARVGLALEQYRLANGKLPEELEALTPDYLPSLPKDVFTNKPLQWERSGIHRYRIPVSDRRGETWNYDPILAAIQLGDVGALERMVKEGWEITKPEPGKEAHYQQLLKLGESQPPDPYYLDVPESIALTQKEAIKLATAEGHVDVVHWLKRHVFKPSHGDLLAAVKGQQIELVKLFLDSGVSPFPPPDPSQKTNRWNDNRETVFEVANAETLQLLLAKVPKDQLPKALEGDKRTSLLENTLAKRDVAKAKLLIQRGANVKKRSLDAIELALKTGDSELTKLLIKNGATINRSGGHPVVKLANQPNSAMIEALLEHGNRPDEWDLKKAAESAASAGLLDNLKLFEKAGVNLDERGIVFAAFRGGNLDLIHHIILKASKPLSENREWSFSIMREFDDLFSLMLEPSSTLEPTNALRNSGANGPATSVTFRNRTGQPVQLVWLQSNGLGNSYASIPDQHEVTQQTYANHVWLVKTKEGESLGVYQAKPENHTVIIGDGNSNPTEQNLAKLRTIAKLLLENGMTSPMLNSEDDLANFSMENLEATREKYRASNAINADEDLIGVDEDNDGFDAYDEKLTGHSDRDPNDKPTQEEVDAALQALEP